MRWHDISKNPNAPEVLAARTAILQETRAPLVHDRIAYLCDLARGKKVLDVGVVDHLVDGSSSEAWLHGRLCKAAKSCIGVDVLEEDVAQLRTNGYDLRAMDLTHETLPEKFDVAVLGEVIEHVDEPAKLLRNIASMMSPDGLIVLTTPNPWYLNVIVKNLAGNTPFTDNVDHVYWFDAGTLCEVGQRAGLVLSRYAGVQSAEPRTFAGRLLFGMAPMLMALGMSKLLFAKTIIYEFRLPR